MSIEQHPAGPEATGPPGLDESNGGVDPHVSFEVDPAFMPIDAPKPVQPAERIASVDVLRGFALLGILAMNIVSFGWPDSAYINPMRGGGFEGLDRAVWTFNHLVFEMKMMTIFSMLFGAGLVLMGDRADAKGISPRGVYYRRTFWLLVIGLIHAHLIWSGDILVLYAECGLLLYLFRNKSPKTLIILGVVVMCVFVPFVLGVGAGIDYLKANAARVEAKKQAGQEPTKMEAQLATIWTKKVQPEIVPDPAKRAKNWNEEMETYRDGYLGIVRHRAGDLILGNTIGFLLGGLWMAGGRMLLGMGLMKLGVFSATCWRGFYLKMIAWGYGLGLPLVAYDAYALIRNQFSMDYMLHGGILLNYFGSILVVFGHIGTIMLIVQGGDFRWLTSRLQAVGRMALSNYLTHSIVCTTLFYGYGFGLFGTLNRVELAGVVLIIWVAQLIYSPIWLRHFRFGPAEWVWRSLTYGKPQPMRRREEVEMAVA